MGLINPHPGSVIQRKNPHFTFYVSVKLTSPRHAYLGFFFFFFLDSEGIENLTLRAIWDFAKEQFSFNLELDYGTQRACF
jgi:hypothetical protein